MVRPALVLALAVSLAAIAQEPATFPAQPEVVRNPAQAEQNNVSPAAIAGAKQDPAAVEQGGKVYGTYCAGCHGVTAKGGPGAPDLIRSLLVLDDEKGILIAPVIREGRPDKGMPKLGLSEPQIAEVVAWLHVRTYEAGHRATYTFQSVLTGNAHAGEAYFKSHCASCHSPTGDLAGIANRFDPFTLQSHWIQPRTGTARRAAQASAPPGMRSKVKVTLPNGQELSGVLDRVDDFTVSFRDSSGVFHSVSLDGPSPAKIEITDPLKAHTDLLHQYTDADVHNMTSYLVTLK